MLTILGPCSLPILPLILGTAGLSRVTRLVGIMVGFGATFVATTVVIVGALAAAGVTTQPLRITAAMVFALAGALLLWPRAADWLGRRALRPRRLTASPLHATGDVAVGLAFGAGIGVLWAPCVAPLMASAIAAAIVEGPSPSGVGIMTVYVAGAMVPLVAIALGGRALALHLGSASRMLRLRRIYGSLMLVAGLAVLTGADLRLQATMAAPAPDGPPSLSAGAVEVDGGPPGVQSGATAVQLADLGPAPELRGITSWINSDSLTMASLRGKVVLVHFWTFACINCLHVQPYVKTWAERYAADGLVVIGVHTPELSFERELDNVRNAVAADGVRFPVAFDPDFATWRAYDNHAWPAFYFVDRTGRIRHVHVGEGDYEGSEAVIQTLLAGG